MEKVRFEALGQFRRFLALARARTTLFARVNFI